MFRSLIGDVLSIVEISGLGDYFLSTVFPTKKIDLEDNSKTLKDFGIKKRRPINGSRIVVKY